MTPGWHLPPVGQPWPARVVPALSLDVPEFFPGRDRQLGTPGHWVKSELHHLVGPGLGLQPEAADSLNIVNGCLSQRKDITAINNGLFYFYGFIIRCQ